VLLCGDGKDRESLIRFAHERGVMLRLLGAVPQHVVAQAYAAADVVALPSYREGMPAVLCEAMLSGRAIVASDAGGIPEIVRTGETGIVHRIGDVDALAAGLARVLLSADFRGECEARAREYAQRSLTWTANAQRYNELYRSIIETRSRLAAAQAP
jgi:glycosyltransferase involved in cell wall biosynthesis